MRSSKLEIQHLYLDIRQCCIKYVTMKRVATFKSSLLLMIDLPNTQTFFQLNEIGNYLQK
jgi:hypothetical protein